MIINTASVKPRNYRSYDISAILIAGLLIFLVFSSTSFAAVFKKNTVIMGTDLEMTVIADSEAQAKEGFDAVASEMGLIEKEMSEWIEGTYVSNINKNAGIKAVAVPDDLFKVISASITISDLSHGALDVTWAAMRGLWDFRPGHERVPSIDEIQKVLPLLNYKNIELDIVKKTVFLKKRGMAIGLGAIAKGYAIDRAMQTLNAIGIKSAIVRAGGDMRVQGINEEGKPWEIGIKHPRNKERLIAKLPLSNISISTSGDYERYFIRNGLLYHHIIDPKIGMPARGVQSVTILAPDTMTSDALSTAVFVLGADEGMKLVERLKGIVALIVDDKGEVHYSSAFEIKK